jgi:dihydroneopterin aldolase
MVRGAKDIPWSWDVTSDSLAAWLAGKARRETPYCSSSMPTFPAGPAARDGSRCGRDSRPGFSTLSFRASGAEASIAGPAGYATAAAAIRNGVLVGARVDLR